MIKSINTTRAPTICKLSVKCCNTGLESTLRGLGRCICKNNKAYIVEEVQEEGDICISMADSQGWRSLAGCHLWGRTESDTTEAT